MKYLGCNSFQNKEFPDFREICYKHSTRYIIHYTGHGCYEFIGEFIDKKADVILENYKSVYECTEAVNYNPLSIIPFSEHFEELMSGNSKKFDEFKSFIKKITECIIGIDKESVTKIINKRTKEIDKLTNLNLKLSFIKNEKN